jgi:acetyl esterase/lipase
MHPWVRSRTGLARCRNPRPFHDEIVDYAERLTVAGVPVDLQIVPGAFHAFDAFVTKAQVSRNFFGSQCVSLRSAFTPSAPDPSARQR